MEREKVDDMLKHFQERKGRYDSIRAEIALIEHQITVIKRNAVNDLVLHGRSFDGMPHGSGVGKPTESAGLRLADGYMPDEARALQTRVEQLQAESQSIELEVLFVEAWLAGLSDRERFIIERHVIGGVPWRLLCYDYGKAYGFEYSKDTLKRVQRRAMEKIYAFAE